MKDLIDFLRELLPYAIAFNVAVLVLFACFFGFVLYNICRVFNKILKSW